jgi:hypothetical protein
VNVQELTRSSVDAEFLEFGFQGFLCQIFFAAFQLIVENIERMYWDFGLLDELQFFFPVSGLFVILCLFPILRIILGS